MLSRILTIFAIFIVCINRLDGAPVVAKARQYIAPLPGFVPVYIRPGDTPLEDINLDLAEAFDSYARKHGRLAFARAHEIIYEQPTEKPREKIREIPEVSDHHAIPVFITQFQPDDISSVDDLSLEENNDVSSTTRGPIKDDSQHIQKIPNRRN